MSAMKRKETSNPDRKGDNAHKKLKKDSRQEKPHVPKAILRTLETDPDSDPIVESDSTSQSGDDDGASWPSDEDNEEWDGVELGEKTGLGDLQIAADATSTTEPETKPVPVDNANPASTSRESHVKQKAMAQERKAAKPNADSIARTKKLWERLRRKSHVPKEERKELVAELFDIITGHVKDFVFKHDSVRVVQTALKYADADQRKMIARELKGEYRTLAESKYAKFLIGKMLVHGDGETRDLVVPEFYGHVRRMIKHPEASWILDDVYRGIATPSQKATLLREWYGAEFALFKSKKEGPASADLKGLLAENPEKRTPIIRSLHDLINLLVQKKTTGFTMLHDAMLQYFLNVQHGSEESTEFIELLKGDEEGDLLKNLAFTSSGARLVCLAFARSNAKDRKLILRAFKETMQLLAYDLHGHKVLLTVYDVIDDTKLIAKSVFSELVKDCVTEAQRQEFLTAATNLNARTSLLYPFSGRSKAILSNDDLKLLNEIHDIRATTSKKDPEVRRKELVAALSPPLLSSITDNARSLVETSFGCQFIGEVMLGAIGERESAMRAVAALTSGDKATLALLETPAAGRMLKALVLGGRFNPATKAVDFVDPPLGFHDFLYANIKDAIVDWATGSNAFVMVGLLEAPGFSEPNAIKRTLSQYENRKKLVEAAGACALNRGSKKSKAERGNNEEEVNKDKGNKGARILLTKLDEVV